MKTMKYKILILAMLLSILLLFALGLSSCGDSGSDGASDDDDDYPGDMWLGDDDDDASWAGDNDDDDDDENSDEYIEYEENGFVSAEDSPFSTFSIDVDTASYTNIRRYLMEQNALPPADAVRIEEMVNYFTYDYPEPSDEHLATLTTNVASCPWQEGHLLMRVGLKAKHIADKDLPKSNLVFLIDVSGSMSENLPLVKQSFINLVNRLGDRERVAIVTYEGGVNVALGSTPCSNKDTIISVLQGLESGGGTNGSGGMEKAYDIAYSNFISGGNNRVILATDGDFNIGTTGVDDLVNLAVERAQDGVFLTILGFGWGINDAMLEEVSNNANGTYGYIDNVEEAERVLNKTLYTLAKDVKIQIEFNPQAVSAYRLIGYDNRMLNYDDFNDDSKDAGDIGPDHMVTALYQLVPVGVDVGFELESDENTSSMSTEFDNAQTVAKTAFRYKPMGESESLLLESQATMINQSIDDADTDFRFAAGVTAFGMILRHSAFVGDASFSSARSLAQSAVGNTDDGTRGELLELIDKAQSLWH